VRVHKHLDVIFNATARDSVRTENKVNN